MVWQVLDLLEYICKAGLLLYLIRNGIAAKEKYHRAAPWILFVQAVVINFWLANSRWLDERIYGDIIGNSAYSIVKLTIGFGVGFFTFDLLYQGRRLAKW